MAVGLEKLNDVKQISTYLNLTESKVIDAINFLVQIGFVYYEGKKLKLRNKFLEFRSDSKLIDRYLLNWRAHAVGRLSDTSDNNLFYSVPFAVNKLGNRRFKEQIRRLIETIQSEMEQVSPEELMCLNIDWFKI